MEEAHPGLCFPRCRSIHLFLLNFIRKEQWFQLWGECPPLCETQSSPGLGPHEQRPAVQTALLIPVCSIPGHSCSPAQLQSPKVAHESCQSSLLFLGFPWLWDSPLHLNPVLSHRRCPCHSCLNEYLHCQPDFKCCTHFLVTLSAEFDLLCIKGLLIGGGSFFLLLYLGMANADARSGDECQPMSAFLYHETYYCHCSPASFGLKIASYYVTPHQAFLWTYIQEKSWSLYF